MPRTLKTAGTGLSALDGGSVSGGAGAVQTLTVPSCVADANINFPGELWFHPIAVKSPLSLPAIACEAGIQCRSMAVSRSQM
jgi:hypothetical protein